MTSAEDAPLVIVKGMAGTAKTFYAVAVGLEKVFNVEKRNIGKSLSVDRMLNLMMILVIFRERNRRKSHR